MPHPTVSIADLSRHLDQTVSLQGWVEALRSSGKVAFLLLRDGTGSCQCVIEARTEPAFTAVAGLHQEGSLRLTGRARPDDRAPGGVEIAVETIEVVQSAEGYPIARKAHGVDFLLQHRHLWLRSARQTAIARIRHTVISAIRGYFDDLGFTLVDTPILAPGAAEGAGTLFTVDYFGEPVYLAQTGQLYLEAAAQALGKVYCFGPTFRAEKSKTRRHLAEFWMVEPEVAWADLPDLEALAEGLICRVVERVLGGHRADLDRLGRDPAPLEAIRAPFPRVTYTEAVEILRSPETRATLEAEQARDLAAVEALRKEIAGLDSQLGQATKAWKQEKLGQEIQAAQERLRELEMAVENRPGHMEDAAAFAWGRDLGGDEETILSRRFDRPLVITRYPKAAKAFYMKSDPENPRVALNLDILAPEGYGEIVGGSVREDDLAALEARMAEEGMDPAPYQWYLDLRRYGSVPHGGFGLGVERTVAWICGLRHIRETIAFPRFMGRLYP